MGTIRIGLISVLLALLVPASANADNAKVFREGVDTFYVGSDSIDDVALSVVEPPKWIFQQGGLPEAALMTAEAGCTDVNVDGKRIACDISGRVILSLAGNEDRFIGGADGHGITVNAGEGDDQLTVCCQSQNTINGDGGDDTIEVGGAINKNTIDGGAGEDLILHPAGPNLINGGPDADTVVYLNEIGDTFSVSLDDAANDGLSGAENIHSDIENLTGGPESDRFTGSAGANTLKGGQGDDELDGGPGQDTLEGGENDDDIHARDGERDTIDCGFGQDSATIDVLDLVVKCEQVVYPDADFDGSGANADCNDANAAIRPGATDVPGDGVDQDCAGGDAVAQITSAPKARALRFSVGSRSLIRGGSGRDTFTCRAPKGDTCSVKGSLTKKRGKAVKIGSVTGRVAGGKTGKLTIRLNQTGRSLLEAAGKLAARLKGTVTNEVGETRALNSTIQLTAPKAKPASSSA
jgi:Ca2+-binding RTX toxin-like protein